MTKEEIYQAMVDWQMDAGEDFLDYFDSSLNAISFMCWARGKGYITIEQFNLWEGEYKGDFSEAAWATRYVHSFDGEQIEYAVVSEEDWTEEGQEKAYGILAEFISESVSYQRKFKEFLEEN